MSDPTEGIRREMVADINSQVEGTEETERERLEDLHGKIWNTKELSESFEVLGFMAPFVTVKSKATGKCGTMMFQHFPRFYFNFESE